ncbi:MAG: aconitase family protein, partial [Candidatus Binataceae bacterium]
MSKNSFDTRTTLDLDGQSCTIHALPALERRGFSLAHLPYSIKVMLENALRREDGEIVTGEHVEALARWNGGKGGAREFAFMPARVLLQDFTGVPAVVDLAAMRSGMRRMGGDPKKINPLVPVDLVIDHSVQVDAFGSDAAFAENVTLEYERNRERYALLR